METKANYAIVGLFTVLVVAAAFAFVYWMANYGRGGETAQLLVRIPGSANGLSIGSPVRFNGIQVGTVRGLRIDQDNPRFVIADTEVRVDAPVMPSTRASLEIQGLTGSAYIELRAGASNGQNILERSLQTGEPAVLSADPSSVANILATADQILQRVNSVVDDLDGFVTQARGPLTETLRNTERFSAALADNADGIDGFLQSVGALADTVGQVSGRLESTLAAAEGLLTSLNTETIDAILGNVETVSAELAAASGEFDDTLDSVRRTVESFGSFGEDARAMLTRVDAIIDDADRLVASVDPETVGQAVDDVSAASASARDALQTLNDVTATFDARSADIDQAITDVGEMAAKLNAASSRVDGVLARLDGFLGQGDASDLIDDAEATLAAFREVATTLNARIDPIASGLQRFSDSGLKDIESLVNDARRAITRIEQSINAIERDPQRLIFGGEQVKQFDGRTRR